MFQTRKGQTTFQAQMLTIGVSEGMASEGRRHLTKEQRFPRCYKDTEKVLKSAKACEGNIKTILNNSRFRGSYFKKVYALAISVLKNYDILEHVIEETGLLVKVPYMRKELAAIMIYEVILGSGELPGESKPVLSIKQYKNDIMTSYQNLKSGSHLNKLKSNAGLCLLPRYARVHTLTTSVSRVLEDLEYHGYQQINYSENILENEYLELVQNLESQTFLIDYHFKDLLVFPHGENLSNWQLYQDGRIFLQDKSSYIPVHVLDPEPGSFVLDACAAPGMKSVHLSARMQNEGLLHACEKDPERFKTLENMLEYGKVKISKSICQDFTLINPSDELYSTVDYILLDPSCSGSGMVNRMDKFTDTEESKNKVRLKNLAGFQIVLLKHALKFPFVKRVVYSTCSVNEEENEYVVHEALNAFNQDFKLVNIMPDWAVRGVENYECGKMCLRAYPEKNLTNGFFVAMFERIKTDPMESSAADHIDLSLNKPKHSSSVLNCKKNKIKKSDNFNGDSHEMCENSYSRNADTSTDLQYFNMHKQKRKLTEISIGDFAVPHLKSENFNSSIDVMKNFIKHKKERKLVGKNNDYKIFESQNVESSTDSQLTHMYNKKRKSFIKDSDDCEVFESQNIVSQFPHVHKKKKKSARKDSGDCEVSESQNINLQFPHVHKKKKKSITKDSNDCEVSESQNINSPIDFQFLHKHKKKRKSSGKDNEISEPQNIDFSADLHSSHMHKKKRKHVENDTNDCKSAGLKCQKLNSPEEMESFQKHKMEWKHTKKDRSDCEISKSQNIDLSTNLPFFCEHVNKRKNDTGDSETSESTSQSSACFAGVCIKSRKHSKKKKHTKNHSSPL